MQNCGIASIFAELIGDVATKHYSAAPYVFAFFATSVSLFSRTSLFCTKEAKE